MNKNDSVSRKLLCLHSHATGAYNEGTVGPVGRGDKDDTDHDKNRAQNNSCEGVLSAIAWLGEAGAESATPKGSN